MGFKKRVGLLTSIASLKASQTSPTFPCRKQRVFMVESQSKHVFSILHSDLAFRCKPIWIAMLYVISLLLPTTASDLYNDTRMPDP